MKTSFTIPEIRKYFEGCLLHDLKGEDPHQFNLALNGALSFLGDKEDGIAEFFAREEHRINKMPLDKFVGCKCFRISPKDFQQMGKTCRINAIDNKKRRLQIDGYWVSTKTFFDKWCWRKNETEKGNKAKTA